MKIKMYQVDAFTDKIFSGNPAAICPLAEWPSDELLQNIAMENNLSETGFYIKNGERYHIRWFTPTVEVDLCGHATLAASYVIFNYSDYKGDEIVFDSKSGELRVKKSERLLTLIFPVDEFSETALTPDLYAGLNFKPVKAYKGKTDYMLIFERESQIAEMKPDFRIISRVNCRGIIVTAKGERVDFVSRFFGPQSGFDEDPVTGSAHTTLVPYWAKILNKNELTAIQLSSRKGYLTCKLSGKKVEISGKAITYMIGEIEIK